MRHYLAITDDDTRWILPVTDPVGRHPWYQAQPRERQIKMGMWYQANIAKAGLQLESILIRGLMNSAVWVPNGSPEHRYCVHEMIEEGQHNLMFQELVNRIGIDVPGLPRYLRWLSPVLPLYAGPMPNVFFFGVLTAEDPYDHVQRSILREADALHPIVGQVTAIHMAEEARHISFSHEHLLWRICRIDGAPVSIPQRTATPTAGCLGLIGMTTSHRAGGTPLADSRPYQLALDAGWGSSTRKMSSANHR